MQSNNFYHEIGVSIKLLKGDPHVIVNTRGEVPICFDVVASDHRFVDLLSDKVSGTGTYQLVI